MRQPKTAEKFPGVDRGRKDRNVEGKKGGKENILIRADFIEKMKAEKKKMKVRTIKAVFIKRYLLNSFKVRFLVKGCLTRIQITQPEIIL